MSVTLGVLAAAAAVFLLAAYLERRPKPDGELLWTPYIGIQMVALVVFMLACAHLITLATGTHFAGRFSG